jgi:methionyl-tRNA formyltransferase
MRETGVSIMQLDAGLDTGPVLAQRACRSATHTTAAQLQHELAQLGAELLLETLVALEAGRCAPSHSLPGVTYAAKIDKAEARIDWHAAPPAD